MLFNSIQFLIFFPVVTLLYFLSPHKYRWLLLLGASCYFYMSFIPAYILILLITIIIIFQKPDYLPEWGALLMGSGGGFGLGYYKGKQSIEDTNVMPAEKE